MEIRGLGGRVIRLCCFAFLQGHGSLALADMRDVTLGDLLLHDTKGESMVSQMKKHCGALICLAEVPLHQHM